jgi:hypothetical protein
MKRRAQNLRGGIRGGIMAEPDANGVYEEEEEEEAENSATICNIATIGTFTESTLGPPLPKFHGIVPPNGLTR